MTDSTTKTCPACFEGIDSRAARCPRCGSLQPDSPGFYRNVPGRLVGGVCAALGRHFNWDAVLVRVVFVASLFVTGGLALWVYGALWAMTPHDAFGRSPAQRVADGLSQLFSTPASPAPAKSPDQG